MTNISKYNIKNINTLKIKKSNKLRRKIIAILLIIIVFSSAFCTSVSAVSYNSWNLIISQIDRSYFYQGGSSLNSSWPTSTQNAWIAASNLSYTFNQYILSTNTSTNLVKQMQYMYDNGYSNQAVSYGTRWNDIWYEINDLITDVSYTCSNGSVTAAQNLCDQIRSEQDRLRNLANEITTSYYTAYTAKDYPSIANDISISGISALNTLWNMLGNILKTIGTNSANTDSLLGMSWTSGDIQGIANTVSGIVKTFAYALACILFGINVTTTSLQYEMLTLRGGVKVFARVLLVKFWIDLAIPICIYMLNMINSLAKQIFNLFTINSIVVFWQDDLIKFDVQTNNGILDTIIKATEKIINFFANFFFQLPILAITVVLIIVIVSVFIKIISRAFELTGLISISPIFFATLVSEETKHYFRKFAGAFLSTAGYMVFMAIVYAVASKWISQCSTASISNVPELAQAFFSVLPRTLIIIACCRIMKKPPKVLTSLFDGG
ncbi:MAG: type IV secretion system protein [Ruminococcus sp.]|nr:type IV secretion system protein [Ruminococcus sp.]